MAGRVTIAPVNLNASQLTPGLWLVAGTFGYDTGSPGGTLTAWSANNGIQFANNGMIVVGYACGATPSSADVLVGRKAGGGLLPAFGAENVTIAASTTGWLGPFSVADFTQTDATQYSGAPAGAIGTAGVGMTCIDFTSTTTLSIRLYQLIPAIP
jgi:hypothetical protein